MFKRLNVQFPSGRGGANSGDTRTEHPKTCLRPKKLFGNDVSRIYLVYFHFEKIYSNRKVESHKLKRIYRFFSLQFQVYQKAYGP